MKPIQPLIYPGPIVSSSIQRWNNLLRFIGITHCARVETPTRRLFIVPAAASYKSGGYNFEWTHNSEFVFIPCCVAYVSESRGAMLTNNYSDSDSSIAVPWALSNRGSLYRYPPSQQLYTLTPTDLFGPASECRKIPLNPLGIQLSIAMGSRYQHVVCVFYTSRCRPVRYLPIPGKFLILENGPNGLWLSTPVVFTYGVYPPRFAPFTA